MIKSIYLDVCSLCRPFDDQSFIRIRFETEAVNLILSSVYKKFFLLLISPVHTIEINSIEDESERTQLEILCRKEGRFIETNLNDVKMRADEFIRRGLGIADAAHVAFAESQNADFISCDDKLLQKCKKMKIRIWTGTPIAFCEKENLQ
jgi:hypothetical protein